MRSHKLIVNIMLLLAALIWGGAFVAQSVGMDYVGPFTFTCARSFIGGIALLPVIRLSDRWFESSPAEKDAPSKPGGKNPLLLGGVLCGAALCLGTCLQQVGLQYTTVGKAGFITALYIILVPILGLFIGKRTQKKIWFCAVVSLVGLYLLCVNESLTFSRGDLLVLLCAIAFAVHITFIDRFSPLVNGVKLSCIQFFVCGVISLVLMLVFEKPELSSVLSAWAPILYAGVLSSGVAYTLQIVAQRHADPTVACLLLSLESVFSVLSAWVLLGQRMSLRELLGCGLMLAAVIFAQLPSRRAKAEKHGGAASA